VCEGGLRRGRGGGPCGNKEGFQVQEKEIERILVREVKKLGGLAYKWVSPGNDGVPDRIVFFPGHKPVFVELKSDTGNLTAVQKAQIKRLEDLGQKVFVTKGIRGVSQFFRDVGFEETGKSLESRYGL